MKIKSLLALLGATTMIASTVVVNAASGAPAPQTKETIVTYVANDSSLEFDGFVVTLPASLKFTSQNRVLNSDVKVTLFANRTIGTGKAINIDVKSDGGYRLQAPSGVTMTTDDLPRYSLKASRRDNPNFNTAGEYNQVSQDNNTNFNALLSSPIVDNDFTGGQDTDRQKVIRSQAELTKLPTVVGVDNATFTDILTYRVQVGTT